MPPVADIDSFTGDYYFLSNFYFTQVKYNGVVYKTSEHAFQAAKCANPKDLPNIMMAPTPTIAKQIGRRIPIIAGWDEIRLEVMEAILRCKFSDPSLKTKLLSTGKAKLVEGNYWGDRFWGVFNGEGENHLGRILMKIRADFEKEKKEEKKA